eukprot:4587141-Prymnesium_polylepis.1
MEFRNGLDATLIHRRIAPSYDHRLDIVCEKGTIQVRPSRAALVARSVPSLQSIPHPLVAA